MGNHDAGRAMAQAAEQWDGTEPLAFLDQICEPWRDCDAEFDDETGPERPLGRLMAAALAPGGLESIGRYTGSEEAEDAWWQEVYDPFRERYQFW